LKYVENQLESVQTDFIRCLKKFKSNISEIVEDNSNFTHEFKSKCLELRGLFFGSVRNTAYIVQKYP